MRLPPVVGNETASLPVSTVMRVDVSATSRDPDWVVAVVSLLVSADEGCAVIVYASEAASEAPIACELHLIVPSAHWPVTCRAC